MSHQSLASIPLWLLLLFLLLLLLLLLLLSGVVSCVPGVTCHDHIRQSSLISQFLILIAYLSL